MTGLRAAVLRQWEHGLMFSPKTVQSSEKSSFLLQIGEVVRPLNGRGKVVHAWEFMVLMNDRPRFMLVYVV